MTERIEPRWAGQTCVVAASGPSLTVEVAAQCRGQRVIAINDAYRRIPDATILYACDRAWWDLHRGCPGFAGERWSSHSPGSDDKLATAAKYGLRLVAGRHEEGFSLDPGLIHYGSNSGFQALNLAILLGAARIVLVGYDMHVRKGRHFFGHHPAPLSNAVNFETLVPIFRRAAHRLPPGRVEIVNATPGSALDCFPRVDLEAALRVEVPA